MGSEARKGRHAHDARSRLVVSGALCCAAPVAGQRAVGVMASAAQRNASLADSGCNAPSCQ